MILGIDEVGRGPWAGPLVVGAVVLNGATIDGLADSKVLSKKKREQLYHEIIASPAAIGLGWVHAEELDRIGMSAALVAATKRAVSTIDVPYHQIIIDGTINFLADTKKGSYVSTLKKADSLIASVSAASIVAKVARDEFMATQDILYPGYDFAAHAGYGTAKHREAIERLGVTPLHRLSFAPLVKYVTVPKRTIVYQQTTPTATGTKGESVAAAWLEANSFVILDRNWKTKLCEIDIVARKHDIYYFVEVKHRKNSVAGGGIAAITNKKLRQMTFAARIYIHFQRIDADAVLAVITTTTNGHQVTFESYIEIE